MYEQFGARVNHATGEVTFRLFIPDAEKAPFEYSGGGLPRILELFVVGSFQNPATREWDLQAPLRMTPSDFAETPGAPVKGVVYSVTTAPLPDGFYEYKYLVHFENADPRLVTDPCGRYGGARDQNSGFVVGGPLVGDVAAIPQRLPLRDLRIYELMIDDFTARYRSPDESPLQAVVRRLDYLKGLGINAIEFMPWTAWTYMDDPNRDFSWGYNPVQYFSAAHKYTLNPHTETEKLVYLKQLIEACHARDIHVIMDGVFNHADAALPDRGFPYYCLYQDPADSPYVGNFAEHAFFQDLDYENQCTLEYIRDACIYWIDTFKIDGIRFDNTLGLYRPGDRGRGLPKLLSELRGHLSRKGIANFSLILEHSWDYDAVDVTNKVGATSCWLDKFRSLSMGYLGDRPHGIPQVEPGIMRLLNASRDFGPGRTPTVYLENHDHRRFMLKAGGRNFWYLTQPYAIGLFTAPGATLIYNGQEFGQDNDMPEDGAGRVIPRPVEWGLEQQDPGPTLQALYRKLMEIREAHPALRSANFYPDQWDERNTLPDSHGFGIDRERNMVTFHRWGMDAENRLERIYVALNFSGQAQHISFEVPDAGPWRELLTNATQSGVDGRLTVDVGSNWGAIYHQSYGA